MMAIAAVVGVVGGSIAYRYYHTGDQAKCCPIEKRTILVLGTSGAGKSTMLNNVLKTTIFGEGHSTLPHTYVNEDVKPHLLNISGSCCAVTAIDTRGFKEPEEGGHEIDDSIKEIKERAISMGGEIHAIFLVFDGTGKLGDDYRKACKAIATLLNATTCNANPMIHVLITHGDRMDNLRKSEVVDEFLNHSATNHIKPFIETADGSGHRILVVSFDKASANTLHSVDLIRNIIFASDVGNKVDTLFNIN